MHELEVHQIELELQNEELRSAQSRLEESLLRYRDLFDLAPVGYLRVRQDGGIVNANLTFAALVGVAREQLNRANLKKFVRNGCQDTFYRHLRMIFDGQARRICELELVRGDGSHFFAQVESVAQDSNEGPPQQCLMVVTDITERRRQEAQIHRQANHDALTDLPNRALFLDRLAYTIRTAQRERTGLALFYIDLDNFKWVNDTYGHRAGDHVLVESARRFKACARDNDTVARLSGDEFCILLPLVCSANDARLVARKVMAAMEPPFELDDGSSVRVSCSAGIAMYPKDCASVDDLMQGADLALYQVKRSGRSHYAFFARKLNEELIRQQKLGLELRNAAGRNELTLRYQPVIDLASGGPVGAEVLVRWKHPSLGLLLPSEFIPAAEENGLIVELGEWVLEEVHRQARIWYEQGLTLDTLWVNLAARQCGDVRLVGRLIALMDALNTWQGRPRVGLEITESYALDFSDAVRSAFSDLQRRGTSLAIDDFGTGFSSLGRLLHLPFDIIKVDKSFVAELVSSAKSKNLVRAVIALGHSMDARVIGEGIETREQLEILRDLECDLGQGFHISEPLMSHELAGFVRRD